MRTILIAVSLYCCCFFAAAQDSVKERWLKFDMMPFNSSLTVFSDPKDVVLPESMKEIYRPKRNCVWGIRSFNLRVVIADRFVAGGSFAILTMPLDDAAIEAKVRADNPGYFVETGQTSNEYNNFGSVLFAGVRFRLNPQWRLETLLDFRMADLKLFTAPFALKDNQSNAFFTRTYSAQIERTKSLGFQCNVLRFGKKFPNLFYGLQLTVGTDLYKGKGFITDHSFPNGTTVTEFDVAQRFNFVGFGFAFGLRFFRGSFN